MRSSLFPLPKWDITKIDHGDKSVWGEIAEGGRRVLQTRHSQNVCHSRRPFGPGDVITKVITAQDVQGHGESRSVASSVSRCWRCTRRRRRCEVMFFISREQYVITTWGSSLPRHTCHVSRLACSNTNLIREKEYHHVFLTVIIIRGVWTCNQAGEGYNWCFVDNNSIWTLHRWVIFLLPPPDNIVHYSHYRITDSYYLLGPLHDIFKICPTLLSRSRSREFLAKNKLTRGVQVN